MKKQHPKQTLRSMQRIEKYRKTKQKTFVFSLLTIFAIISVVSIFLDPINAGASMQCFAGSTILASMMAIGDIGDLADTETTGKNIWGEVYLIDVMDQIDSSQAFPMPNAAREVGTIPMLAGQYMKKFFAHTPPTFLSTGEKGEMTVTGETTFTITMAGQRKQLLNFIEQHTGKKFIIVFRQLGSNTKYILGSYEMSVVLQSFENKMDNDGRYVTFTFKREGIQQYHEYTGSMTLQAPAVHTAGQTALAITAGQDVYTIPNGAAAVFSITSVTGLSAADKGRIITLIGSGTTYPASVADAAPFVLEDGTAWTAKSGSKLVLKVLDPTSLVEIGSSRIQTA